MNHADTRTSRKRRRPMRFVPLRTGFLALTLWTLLHVSRPSTSVLLHVHAEEKKRARPMGMKINDKVVPSGATAVSPPAASPLPQRQYPSISQDHDHHSVSTGQKPAEGSSIRVPEVPTASHRRSNRIPPRQTNATIEEKDFMRWCKKELGIETILEIKTFEYPDYMSAMPTAANDDIVSPSIPLDSIPTVQVRGLAATRDIKAGETVITIPVQALLSVSTTVDQDPVLHRMMGPHVRQEYQWVTEDQEDASYLIEMPLLAVALLYHRRLGIQSPLYNYIRILETTPTDTMPYLWSNQRLQETNPEIRRAAKAIRDEMQSMYSEIVQRIIDAHPDVFGPKEGEEWFYSMDKFSWAFAMLNSRHWELPMDELNSHDSPFAKSPKPSPADEVDQQGLPPASMPTANWVHEVGEVDDVDAKPQGVTRHAFLAPVADLLNFGPPCTRGIHNKEAHTFEITATCDFRKGQEVTFWYSDECDHIMVSVYGFTHPIVPPCPSADEYRRLFEDWRDRAKQLELLLSETNEDLHHESSIRKKLEEILDGCDCCDNDDSLAGKNLLRHENTGIRLRERDTLARHGIRRSARSRSSSSRKSEF